MRQIRFIDWPRTARGWYIHAWTEGDSSGHIIFSYRFQRFYVYDHEGD